MSLCNTNKSASVHPPQNWSRNALLFGGAPRIIGRTNRKEERAMTCKTVVKKRTDAPSVFVSDIVSI